MKIKITKKARKRLLKLQKRIKKQLDRDLREIAKMPPGSILTPCKARFRDLPCTYFEDRSADDILDAKIIE